MNKSSSISDLRVQDLIAAIGSAHVSPGAGAAGAVTLALAAACATKAVVVSLKHHPADKELQDARAATIKIGSFALSGADRDAEAFEAFIRARNTGATARLLDEGEKLARLIEALFIIVRELEPRIEPSMAGDLIAAKALADAAHIIQSANEMETKESQGTGGDAK